MLRVVCWLWQKKSDQYRTTFTAEHVNTFRNMVERHYTDPHEVVCITNMPDGIDERVRVVPLWDEFHDIPSQHGDNQPSCFTRVRAFSSEMRELIGPRFVSVDLDCVIVNDMRPLWNRTEDFVIYNYPMRTTPYNGSMWLMDAGCREQVYTRFKPESSPMKARKAGFRGSDQAWFCYALGRNEATWGYRDGVVAFRSDMKARDYMLEKVPHARIVFFQGVNDPWGAYSQSIAPWIKEHYR
jgi:hypothetical protein